MTTSAIPWEQPGWLEDASTWLQAEVDHLGWQPAGALEQPHIRPWSTVLRLPTDHGMVYFKATAPSLHQEARLTQYLSAGQPEYFPTLLAVDVNRGWMLMREGGTLLRSRLQATGDPAPWRTILPCYARLQIRMIPQAEALLQAGALDRRLETLPGLFTTLLQDERTLRPGQPDGLTAGEYKRLQNLTPCVQELCIWLAGQGIPCSLHHDDFHDGNIFYDGSHIVFFDWGESCLAHPFFTLVVGLRAIAYRFGWQEDHPTLLELRQLYLQTWQSFAPLQRLEEIQRTADVLGRLNRALTWHRVVAPLEGAAFAEHAGSVSGWLQEFLAALESLPHA